MSQDRISILSTEKIKRFLGYGISSLIASDSVYFFLPSPFCVNIPILCGNESLLIQSQLIWHLWLRLGGFKFTLLPMKKGFLKKVNTTKKISRSLIYLKRYDSQESSTLNLH